jgi:hypothetical protein
MKSITKACKSNWGLPVLLLWALCAHAQVAPYTKAGTLVTGNWPSMNNKGTMVWSQLDQSGFWQVWMTLQNSPFSSTSQQVTSGNQNHERPQIDDNGDIIYFQDGTGEGAGWEVILLKNGVQSVLEFSSANPTTCKPPSDPTCVFWHTAGQNFGIAADGTTISYFDFCRQGNPPSCQRNFDVSGIGTLQCAGQACLFYGYDYPTINSNGQFAFTDPNHCCPARILIESIGCRHRSNPVGSLRAERPVKWAFSRKV